jgi:hypothetical protein
LTISSIRKKAIGPGYGEKMTVKLLWENCSEFVVEGQDGFFIEASQGETIGKILPALSAHEKLKFDQMKNFYVAATTGGFTNEGCYYFLVSRDAQTIKFESAEFIDSDLSVRGGMISILPETMITRIDEITGIETPEWRNLIS